MVLLFRLVYVLIACRSRPRVHPLEEARMFFRVWPNDLDLNMHMNNGRYLSMMDLGRLDLMARCGIGGAAIRRKWFPLVGQAHVQFIRSLRLFERFELTTRILCWDEKWFYLEHRIEREGELVARGFIKGLFRGREGNVPTSEVISLRGEALASPPVPPSVEAWMRMGDVIRG